MSNSKKQQVRQQGFTLMELLIVVAIIAVLVAIAIPILSGALSKSRRAACAANRRSLKAQLSIQYMAGDRTTPESGTENVDLGALKNQFVCPSGGEIKATVDAEGKVTVTCSIHTQEEDVSTEDKQKAFDTAFAALAAAYDNLSDVYNRNIDSVYRNTGDRWAAAVYNSLTQEQRDLLEGYVWKIQPKNDSYRIYFVKEEDFNEAVANGTTFTYYKYDPVTGQYQASDEGTVKNDGTYNLINTTGRWGDWSDTLPEGAMK